LSAWTGQTGLTERTGRPEHDSKDMTARHKDRAAGTGQIDRTDSQNMTAWTGQWGQENWVTRVLRQAAGTGQVGRAAREDCWDRTTVAGQSWQERYNGGLKKTRHNSGDRTTKTGVNKARQPE
jgi:hypothetical protein